MKEPGRPGFGLETIGQVALPARDIEKAIAFYRDALGMKFLFKAPPDLGFFDCGGVRLMIDGSAGGNAGGGSVIYFRVENLKSAVTTLSGRGVKFETEPHLVAKMADHELWMAFLRDPDRNLLALMSEVR